MYKHINYHIPGLIRPRIVNSASRMQLSPNKSPFFRSLTLAKATSRLEPHTEADSENFRQTTIEKNVRYYK